MNKIFETFSMTSVQVIDGLDRTSINGCTCHVPLIEHAKTECTELGSGKSFNKHGEFARVVEEVVDGCLRIQFCVITERGHMMVCDINEGQHTCHITMLS